MQADATRISSSINHDKDKQLPPLPSPDTVPSQVQPSVFGAITRAVALSAGTTVNYLALNASLVARGFVRWWFGIYFLPKAKNVVGCVLH